jgi:hypothetical protein
VPLLLGIFIAYTLSPIVRWLERWHIKRAIGATLVTGVILVGMALTVQRVQGEILQHHRRTAGADPQGHAPDHAGHRWPAVDHPAGAGRRRRDRAGRRERRRRRHAPCAARRAQSGAGVPASQQVPGASNFRIMDWLLAGSVGLASFVSQATMVVFLVFFLLLAGDTFKRKLVKLTGPSLTRKR